MNCISIKKIPWNLVKVFKPIYRIEVFTGFVGYTMIIHGLIGGSYKESLTGLAMAGLSGTYGAFKDGCFIRKQKKEKTDITDKFW